MANEDRQHPGVKLPFVHPIILFQVIEGWNKGHVLEGLFDLEGLDPKLHSWVPRFEIDLIHKRDQKLTFGLKEKSTRPVKA